MSEGMMYAILGVSWVFGWAIFALVASHLSDKGRQRRLEMLHEERMKAMEKGVPLPELGEWLDEQAGPERGRPGRGWLPAGLVLFTGGVGLSLAMFLAGGDLRPLWSFGLVGVFLAVGCFLQHWLVERRRSTAAD